MKADFASRIFDGLISNRLVVLMYHRVRSEPDPLSPDDVDARRFAAHLSVISRHFVPLGLPEALARIRAGDLPSRAVCITFDDGYEDNFSVAAPLLRASGLSATFFIATDDFVPTEPGEIPLSARGFPCLRIRMASPTSTTTCGTWNWCGGAASTRPSRPRRGMPMRDPT